jgi:ABC-type lipoprotein export system ATPase subunit
VAEAFQVLVRIRDLRYSYPGGPEILRIPVLDISGRGLIAVTGPSGAGKSTLIELLAGTLHEGYEGSVEVLGREWRDLRRDADRQRHLRRIGFIPQDFGLLPSKTPRETLKQDLIDADVPVEEHEERIERALSEMELMTLADQRISSLSGGQSQRVAVARMLARDVDLVIADEPTANLDPGLRSVVMDLLRRISLEVPVIVVTHDGAVAEACDRTIILQAATLSAEGLIQPTRQKVTRPRSTKKRVLQYSLLIVALGAILAGVGYAFETTPATEKGPQSIKLGPMSLGGIALFKGNPLAPSGRPRGQILPGLIRELGHPKLSSGRFCHSSTPYETAQWNNLTLTFVGDELFQLYYGYNYNNDAALPPAGVHLSPRIVTASGATVGDDVSRLKGDVTYPFGPNIPMDGAFSIGVSSSHSPQRITSIFAAIGNC